MNRKQLKYPFLALILLLIPLSSCSDWIEIAPETETEILLPQSESELEELLLGTYAGLGESGAYGDSFWLLGELSVGWLTGETFWDAPSSPIDAIAFSRIEATNSEVRKVWTQTYQTVNAANLVLSNLQLAGSNRLQIEGEARAIRALLYFELLMNFSSPTEEIGVPLVLRAGETGLPSRASRAEVFSQIVSDLEFARENLSNENVPYRFSRFAATALLARVRLQQKQYEAARDLANQVIRSEVFSLTEAPLDAAFSLGNSEMVFGILRTSSQSGSLASDYVGRVEVLASHLALYDANDRRRNFFTANGSRFRCIKFQESEQFLPLIRLSEMYLVRAEANFELQTNTGDTPRNDLNRLRFRAGLVALGTFSEEELWRSRRRELAYEGHYLRDVRRWQIDPGNVPFDAPNLVLPIPQSEIEANPNLIQNEGY
ncbi:MAG: RagB/SusD family nutrient uptake outer membrane protein [Bacteroidota bacterium]